MTLLRLRDSGFILKRLLSVNSEHQREECHQICWLVVVVEVTSE